MLDGIEEIGEASGSFGPTELRHLIRLSNPNPPAALENWLCVRKGAESAPSLAKSSLRGGFGFRKGISPLVRCYVERVPERRGFRKERCWSGHPLVERTSSRPPTGR